VFDLSDFSSILSEALKSKRATWTKKDIFLFVLHIR
jgi:hypothetical protein